MAAQDDTVDMSLFYGTPEEKQIFCESLVRLLKQRGCIKVQNHRIPDEMVHKLFAYSREFFNLPLDEKMKSRRPEKANPNRGYSFVGQENVAGISGEEKGLGPATTKDVKETLDVGASTDTLVANIWPSEDAIPGFQAFIEKFYDEAFKTELDLLSAIAIALGVSEEHLRSIHNKAENEFRLLHYPEIPTSYLSDTTSTRIAEHTDFGTLTLLFQDSTGGLQVENQDQHGTFHDVISSAPTDIIINIGDSLQRLTNDTFRAACHRVTWPSSVQAGEDKVIPERYSAAYFGKPNRAASLLPLKEFITAATPQKYDEDITAWEWNNRRIVKLFS